MFQTYNRNEIHTHEERKLFEITRTDQAGFRVEIWDTESADSGDESSLVFSELTDSEQRRGNAQVPSSLARDTIPSAESSSFSDSPYSELYASAHSNGLESYDEPIDLITSTQALDAERQRHVAVIAELDDSHRQAMSAYAAEVQELQKSLDVFKEGNEAQETRLRKLLQEKEESQTQFAETLQRNAILSAENDRLSKEGEQLSHRVHEVQTKLATCEQDCKELLTSKDALSTQLLNRAREVEELAMTIAKSAEDLASVREDAATEATRLRRELNELTASSEHTNNNLQNQLEDITHELAMERTKARAAAVHSADEISTLTEARDGLRADLDHVCRERDALANSSQCTIHDLNAYIHSLRAELENSTHTLQMVQAEITSAREHSSGEINSLALALQDSQAQYEECIARVSSLEDVVEAKEKQLNSVRAEKDRLEDEFKRSRTAMMSSVNELQKERDTLKRNVARLEQQAKNGWQASSFQRTQDLGHTLRSVRSQKDELLSVKNQEIERLRTDMQAQIDSLRSSSQARIDELSRQTFKSNDTAQARERDNVALRAERDSLKRDLEASRTGQQLQRELMSSDLRALRARMDAANAKSLSEQKAKQQLQNRLSQQETELGNLRAQLARTNGANPAQLSQVQVSAIMQARDHWISSPSNERSGVKELEQHWADSTASRRYTTTPGNAASTSTT